MNKCFIAFSLMFICNSSLFASTKSSLVIYGQDNRTDIKDIKSKSIRDLSKSVAARVHRWSYENNLEDGRLTTTIRFYDPAKLSDVWGANVCSDEKFANQPTVSDCTGFLIADDLLVTAGHCVTEPENTVKNGMTYQCEEFQWLFDYDETKSGSLDLENVAKDKMYQCKKVIYAVLDDDNDFAIIKLDRKVKDRVALKIRKKSKIADKTPLFVIGHPSGLPTKFSGGANVIGNSEKHYFSTNLDTFGGNSGSPVFNTRTHEVEGILVRGKTDYVISTKTDEDCMRVNKCNARGKSCSEDDDDIDGEQVTRIIDILQYI